MQIIPTIRHDFMSINFFLRWDRYVAKVEILLLSLQSAGIIGACNYAQLKSLLKNSRKHVCVRMWRIITLDALLVEM
jgi:hypothetical protein